ncbi:hypothetical protein EYF80_057877 [Liparis tanakae]|uniref:Uncharacterized protein n=1 Tax=Liparis tanakae TaxID=230148 RepID=A0A4Z2ESY9_9TELE|nr:hypothetical protein EYF80_057877 [Liparis tanakae]
MKTRSQRHIQGGSSGPEDTVPLLPTRGGASLTLKSSARCVQGSSLTRDAFRVPTLRALAVRGEGAALPEALGALGPACGDLAPPPRAGPACTFSWAWRADGGAGDFLRPRPGDFLVEPRSFFKPFCSSAIRLQSSAAPSGSFSTPAQNVPEAEDTRTRGHEDTRTRGHDMRTQGHECPGSPISWSLAALLLVAGVPSGARGTGPERSGWEREARL